LAAAATGVCKQDNALFYYKIFSHNNLKTAVSLELMEVGGHLIFS